MRRYKRNQKAADAFRIMDSLSSDEQLILQCCAMLGKRFSRDLLLYVLCPSSPLDFALALKKLFELKVLACDKIDKSNRKMITTPESIRKLFPFKDSACARGDIGDEATIIAPENTLSLNNSKGIICNCRDNKIHRTCLNLPKYASCGYMKFCSTLVREIIYHISTDGLKSAIHLRIVEYLEKQKANCRNCDYGPIHKILNPTAEQDSTESSMRHQPSTSKDQTPTKIIYDGQDGMEEFNSIWGFRRISKLKNCDSLIRDFSSEDSHVCECLSFINAAYSHITAYYRYADKRHLKTSKVLDIMLQYANLLIRSSDLHSAIKILGTALIMFERTPPTDLAWQNNLVRAKIFTLLGNAYLESGQFAHAERYLRSASKLYGCEFSPEKLSSKFKALRLRLKQSIGLFVLPNTLTKKNLNQWKSYVCNSASEVLSHLATLFMKKSQWEYADFAATWGLLKALKTNDHFETVCTAYSNMITVAVHFKRTKLCTATELYALRLCKMQTEIMTKNELKAVTELYTAICWSALSSGDKDKTKQFAEIALRIAESIQC